MKKFGLLGYPLQHSISHFIHRRFFALNGLTDYEYDLYEVNPEELSFRGDCIKQLNGFNVTIPYKLEIVPYLNRLDISAERYGAVNCVGLEESARGTEFIGYNTDGYGFLKSIEELGAGLESAKVLLIGCGGTGRMMAIESVLAGADLTIAIRHTAEAEKAAARLSQEMSETAAKTGSKIRITYTDRLNIANRYDIVLNSTPCGMFPNVDEIPIVAEILNKVSYLFDAVYNPTPTKLIHEGDKRGLSTLGGINMLVHQAALSQKIWNGVQISDNIIRAIINESRQQVVVS
jgi:shikimate dehydrogenase